MAERVSEVELWCILESHTPPWKRPRGHAADLSGALEVCKVWKASSSKPSIRYLTQNPSYSRNSLKRVIQGIIQGSIIGIITRHARSLGYSSYVPHFTKGHGRRRGCVDHVAFPVHSGLSAFAWLRAYSPP